MTTGEAAIMELGEQALKLLKAVERGACTRDELADMLWSRAHLLDLLPKSDATILLERASA